MTEDRLKLVSCGIIPLTPLSADPTKWSNTLKQYVRKSELSVCI